MKPSSKASPQQLTIDLAAGEAAYSERLNDIELAIDRLDKHCDAEMSLLLRLVFSYTHGGKSGTYRRSLAQLATRRGLCCGRTKAQQTIETAERWGLITVSRNRRPDGAPLPNDYTICWEGIQHVRMYGTPWPGAVGANSLSPPGGIGMPPGGLYIRNKQSSSGLQAYSGPEAKTAAPSLGLVTGQEAGPDREMDVFREDDDPDFLRDDLLATIPELISAREIELEPLPVQNLQEGVYRVLTVSEVQKPLSLVAWFRAQLSALRPVMQGTEADLLLVLAAALYVQHQPRQEITKPVGLLVNIISHRNWLKVVPYVREARGLLDAAIEACGAKPLGRKTQVPSP